MLDRETRLRKVGGLLQASTDHVHRHLPVAAPVPAYTKLSKNRLNVTLLIRALSFGGAERQIVYLAQGLARRGHRVSIVTFYAGGPFEDSFPGPNPQRIVLGKRGRWDVVGFSWRLMRSMALQQPDVIYSFLPVSNLLAALFRSVFYRRSALVWGLRGTSLELACYGPLERLSTRLERLASRLPDLVIANSLSGTAWARSSAFGAARVATILNGIDTDQFRPATPEERTAARAMLGCPPTALVVAVVARLDPMKDHPAFLQAVAIAAETTPHIVGLIVGDGPQRVVTRLKARAIALGIADRVIWAAARRQVSEIYHATDILCLPAAFGEGFPNVVGEAMACGLSCIVTAVGDAADLVGMTGRVVPPRDPRALARAMLDLLKPIRESHSCNLAARRRIVENFKLETMISATESLLLQGVARRARRDPESTLC